MFLLRFFLVLLSLNVSFLAYSASPSQKKILDQALEILRNEKGINVPDSASIESIKNPSSDFWKEKGDFTSENFLKYCFELNILASTQTIETFKAIYMENFGSAKNGDKKVEFLTSVLVIREVTLIDCFKEAIESVKESKKLFIFKLALASLAQEQAIFDGLIRHYLDYYKDSGFNKEAEEDMGKYLKQIKNPSNSQQNLWSAIIEKFEQLAPEIKVVTVSDHDGWTLSYSYHEGFSLHEVFNAICKTLKIEKEGEATFGHFDAIAKMSNENFKTFLTNIKNSLKRKDYNVAGILLESLSIPFNTGKMVIRLNDIRLLHDKKALESKEALRRFNEFVRAFKELPLKYIEDLLKNFSLIIDTDRLNRLGGKTLVGAYVSHNMDKPEFVAEVEALDEENLIKKEYLLLKTSDKTDTKKQPRKKRSKKKKTAVKQKLPPTKQNEVADEQKSQLVTKQSGAAKNPTYTKILQKGECLKVLGGDTPDEKPENRVIERVKKDLGQSRTHIKGGVLSKKPSPLVNQEDRKARRFRARKELSDSKEEKVLQVFPDDNEQEVKIKESSEEQKLTIGSTEKTSEAAVLDKVSNLKKRILQLNKKVFNLEQLPKKNNDTERELAQALQEIKRLSSVVNALEIRNQGLNYNLNKARIEIVKQHKYFCSENTGIAQAFLRSNARKETLQKKLEQTQEKLTSKEKRTQEMSVELDDLGKRLDQEAIEREKLQEELQQEKARNEQLQELEKQKDLENKRLQKELDELKVRLEEASRAQFRAESAVESIKAFLNTQNDG